MKNESSNRSSKKIALWSALVGGALGFAAGMIVAPQRGPDTRRRLAYQLERVALRAGTFFRELAGSSTESEARRTGDALVADAQARADHIRDDIDALLEELRKKSTAADPSATNGD